MTMPKGRSQRAGDYAGRLDINVKPLQLATYRHWRFRAHGFVNRVHEPNRHQTIKGRHQRLGAVNNRIDERTILLHVTPLLLTWQLLHRLLRKVTFKARVVSETLHLARHERRMMAEHFDSLERKQPARIRRSRKRSVHAIREPQQH